MTELRKQINNIVEDHQACLVLANSIKTSEVYEGTTATKDDILKGKTAYSNGELIEGELEIAVKRVSDVTGLEFYQNVSYLRWDNVAKGDPNILGYILQEGDTTFSFIEVPDVEKVTRQINGHILAYYTYDVFCLSKNPEYLNGNKSTLKRGLLGTYTGTANDIGIGTVFPNYSRVIGCSTPEDLVFSNGVNMTSGTTAKTFGFKSETGYASTMNYMFIRPKSAIDGKRIHLLKTTLSTGVPISYTMWYGYTASSSSLDFNGDQTLKKDNAKYYGGMSITDEYTYIPSDSWIDYYRVLALTFKCGDGSRNFTEEELEELKTCFEIIT